MRNRFFLCFLISISFCSTSSAQQPWRLKQALGLPEWLHFSIAHRTRYETLDEQYRYRIQSKPGDGGDQVLALRTLVHAKVDLPYFIIGAEMMDSRIYLADKGSATSNSRVTPAIVNPLELLQAYIEVPFKHILTDKDQGRIRVGRITMDVGSRRLIARNNFRNTINAFTGVDLQWRSAGRQLRAFYTLPVKRWVDADILENKERFDEESEQIRFWGINYSQNLMNTANKGEVFLYGLNENDTREIKTKDRELYTFGFRVFRKPATEQFDFQLESIYQLGESRINNNSTLDLEHWAHMQHIEIGYSFDLPWSPRLIAQYDYASGDDNPNDGGNNRFDTLFGGRRFDFGPTSIFASFARSNLSTPGLRLLLKPSRTISSMFSFRGFWRADTDDVWTTAGFNGTESYIGSQLETRLRWDALPGNLRLESGLAYLIAGDLMNEMQKQDSTYGYLQALIKF